MWDNTTNYNAAGRNQRYFVYDACIHIFRICAGTSAGNSSCSNRQRGDSSKCSCLQSTGCDREYPQKYSVSDSPDSCDSTYQTDRGTELWLQCNDRTACNCSGSVHCPYGGIFTERSGTGSTRGSSQHGRRNTDDHLESSSCRSKNFSSCRSNNRRRNNSWVIPA